MVENANNILLKPRRGESFLQKIMRKTQLMFNNDLLYKSATPMKMIKDKMVVTKNA